MNFESGTILHPIKHCIIATLVILVTLVHFRHFTKEVATLKKYQFI